MDRQASHLLALIVIRLYFAAIRSALVNAVSPAVTAVPLITLTESHAIAGWWVLHHAVLNQVNREGIEPTWSIYVHPPTLP